MNLICTAFLLTTIWLPITTVKLNNVKLHNRACAAPQKVKFNPHTYSYYTATVQKAPLLGEILLSTHGRPAET